ncbi:MAG: hypothetical protein RL653_2535 [Pseudomonadota bacterium]|jgi:NTE family protein
MANPLSTSPRAPGPVCLLATLSLFGCSTVRVAKREGTSRTCVVMAGRGQNGLANVGALRALQRASIPVDCVVGTDMGALAGGLYASAPGENVRDRFLRFVRTYDAQSSREGVRTQAEDARVVMGVFTALPLGGVGGAAQQALSGATGAVVQAAMTDPLDHGRFVRALNLFVDGRTLEDLPVPLITQVRLPTPEGLGVEPRSGGKLSEAVGSSVPHPWVFHPTGDVGTAPEPAPPTAAACQLFPGSSLVVVNLTGQPLQVSGALACPVLEVKVPGFRPRIEDAFEPREIFDQAVGIGDDATERALDAQQWTLPEVTAEPVQG